MNMTVWCLFQEGKTHFCTLVPGKSKKTKVLILIINFLRDQVLENTEKALKKLGVSIYQFKPSFEIVKEMMKF